MWSGKHKSPVTLNLRLRHQPVANIIPLNVSPAVSYLVKMYPLPVSFILHYIENGKIWVYSRKKLKGPWRSSSHSKENCVSTAEGSGLGESSPISTNESPLDMLGWRVTVLGQRIMFYSIAGLMLSSFASGYFQVPCGTSPGTCRPRPASFNIANKMFWSWLYIFYSFMLQNPSLTPRRRRKWKRSVQWKGEKGE